MAAMWAALLLAIVAAGSIHVEAGIVPPYPLPAGAKEGRRLVLVPTPSAGVVYHNGPVLSGKSLPVYIIWYGPFSKAQKSIVLDFLGSFAPSGALAKGVKTPSVSTWWSLTASYKDAKHHGVSPAVRVGGQVSDELMSLGKVLTQVQAESLITKSLKTFHANPGAIYLLLTAADVTVGDFCMASCGSHATVTGPKKMKLPYVWVGNPATQCPGMCAWPFAPPAFPGSAPFTPLKAPNGDVGVDGMLITVASLLAGAATNPFDNAYYQGDPGYPLEAATACQGLFGFGSYAGNPGTLLLDRHKRSFNAYGIRGREFLMPALWNLNTNTCKTLPR